MYITIFKPKLSQCYNGLCPCWIPIVGYIPMKYHYNGHMVIRQSLLGKGFRKV